MPNRQNEAVFDFRYLYIKNLSERARILALLLSPIFLLIQIQLVRLLVGLLVGKSYHTKQKDSYSLPTNSPTNNRTK